MINDARISLETFVFLSTSPTAYFTLWEPEREIPPATQQIERRPPCTARSQPAPALVDIWPLLLGEGSPPSPSPLRL